MRPLEFAGAGRWFGLVTRRTDAQNYYYVTFRSPNVVSLRRMRDGVFTELAARSVSTNFQTGRNYRMRLESVGHQHAVFIDGVPLLFVKDSTLPQGHPGVAGYRTRFDVDNVIVSGGTRVLLRSDGSRNWSEGWRSASGTWAFASDGTTGYLRQSDNQADARWLSKIAVGYQSISTRVRPLSHGSGSDPWIGLAARFVDDNNYHYLTLRRSQQLSLRRLVNGQVQVLATVPQALTLGAWHDLRLEIIGNQIRAYVNGDLRIEATDSDAQRRRAECPADVEDSGGCRVIRGVSALSGIESDDRVRRGSFALTKVRRFARFHAKPLELEGQTFARQRRGAVRDVEMQMWFRGVAREPERREHLAAPHMISRRNPDAAGLEVFVYRESSAADVEGDIVAGGLVERMLRIR